MACLVHDQQVKRVVHGAGAPGQHLIEQPLAPRMLATISSQADRA
jgi:hypothetical protein